MTKGTVQVATYQDTLLAKTEKKCEVVDPKKLTCAIKFLYCIKTDPFLFKIGCYGRICYAGAIILGIRMN